MDSTIIRLPRVANASVPLAVNRQARGKQHEKPHRSHGEQQSKTEFTDLLEEAPGKDQMLATAALEPATPGRLADEFSGVETAMQFSPSLAEIALEKVKQEDAQLAEAHRQAYREGFASGVEDGRREFAVKGEEIATLVGSLGALRGELLNEVEDDVVAIVFQAVTAIVGDLLTERDGVVEVVRQVISQVRDRENLIVRVSSRDFELIKTTFAQDSSPSQRVEVVAEPRILPGGCLVESSAGTLDGRLEVQLQSLRELLQGVRSGAGNA